MSRELQAKTRETKTKGDLQELRKNFQLPGIVYGHGIDNTSISLDYNDFASLFDSVGMSSLINLKVDGKKEVPVLISEVQKDPVSDRYTHVDLHVVKMDEKIRTEVVLNMIGDSPAVKSLGGNLIISKDTLNIECLPKDLLASIDIDISTLTQLDDSISVADLNIPEAVTVLDDPTTSIVSVLAPKIEKVKEETSVEGEAGAEGEEGAASGEAKEGEAEEGAKEEKKEEDAS